MSPAPSKSTRARFHEIVVEGQSEHARGLLTGLFLGAGERGRIWFATEVGVRTPLGERILEKVRLHAGLSHVIADGPARKLIRSMREAMEEHGVRIVSEQEIVSARFEYEYHCHARKYAKQIRDALGSLPESLKREGEKPQVTVDRSAEGVEVYSPVHDFEEEARGAVSGARVDLLIEARRKLDELPLVKTEPIELELG